MSFLDSFSDTYCLNALESQELSDEAFFLHAHELLHSASSSVLIKTIIIDARYLVFIDLEKFRSQHNNTERGIGPEQFVQKRNALFRSYLLAIIKDLPKIQSPLTSQSDFESH